MVRLRKGKPWRRWTWAHRATAALFLVALILGRFDWFPWLKGSTTATHLFGTLWLADPLAGLEVTLATRHLSRSLLVAASLLLLFYALAGRLFCSWVCPLGLILDLNDDLRTWVARRLRRHRRRLPNLPIPGQTKYWLLAIVLILSLVTRLPFFQMVSPINLVARSLIFAFDPALLVVVGLIAFEYLSRRAWCRALCPLGAFYSLVGRWGRVRVLINQEKEQAGRSCGLCTLNCPMGIPVLEQHVQAGKTTVEDPECTRCGGCVDPCPRGSLRLGLHSGLSLPILLGRARDAGVRRWT